MIKEAYASAATVQEAVELAKKELNAPDSADVKIEVVEQPTKKILGLFGGSPARVKAYYELTDTDKAIAYLKTMLKGIGINSVDVKTHEEDKELTLELDCGDDYGIAIGRRGETLDALQYLTRLVINKGGADYKRVSINIGDYREKRESTLTALAHRTANRVAKSGRNVTLEPMNPYERRIIHTAVQDVEGVTSHSVGSDTERRVVITLKDGVKPKNPGKGGRGGYNRGRGGKGGRGGDYNRSSQPKEPREPREPRKDASIAGISKYGKLN